MSNPLPTFARRAIVPMRTASLSASPPPAGRSAKRFAPSTRTLPVRGDRRCEMPKGVYVRKPRTDVEVRFWAKVSVLSEDECWEWQHAVADTGYGIARWGGRLHGAHRVAWIITNGPIPPGLYVCHHCDNRLCCNAKRCLFLGTHADNMADMNAKGRQVVGERHGLAKLTEGKVREMRARYAAGGVTQDHLAREFGVSRSNAWSTIRRITWKNI